MMADAIIRPTPPILRTIQRVLWPPVDPALVDAVVTITCSAGVAVSPLDRTDAVSLLSIADVRLLAAKKAGRDRLMVAG